MGFHGDGSVYGSFSLSVGKVEKVSGTYGCILPGARVEGPMETVLYSSCETIEG